MYRTSHSLSLIVLLFSFLTGYTQDYTDSSHIIQFVFTSDAHYGIRRSQFRGKENADAQIVNEAMVRQINKLPFLKLPLDSGILSGEAVGAIDFLIEGGDIANRMEFPIQSAEKSWSQFQSDYINGLKLKDRMGQPAKIFILAGNHDISNAIGFYKKMIPATDASSMAGIYNLTMNSEITKTKSSYNYSKDRIHYSRNIAGIHFQFLCLWPDSAERIWMENDLEQVSPYTPVIIFTHDQPESEAKHFTNPNPPYDIDSTYKFENLLEETYKDDRQVSNEKAGTRMEQSGWINFLKAHSNIKAYFHGNSNYSEFYTYRVDSSQILLPVFRVDSPMKGKYSSKDEKLLSFDLIL
jgi:hypothetical protein